MTAVLAPTMGASASLAGAPYITTSLAPPSPTSSNMSLDDALTQLPLSSPSPSPTPTASPGKIDIFWPLFGIVIALFTLILAAIIIDKVGRFGFLWKVPPEIVVIDADLEAGVEDETYSRVGWDVTPPRSSTPGSPKKSLLPSRSVTPSPTPLPLTPRPPSPSSIPLPPSPPSTPTPTLIPRRSTSTPPPRPSRDGVPALYTPIPSPVASTRVRKGRGRVSFLPEQLHGLGKSKEGRLPPVGRRTVSEPTKGWVEVLSRRETYGPRRDGDAEGDAEDEDWKGGELETGKAASWPVTSQDLLAYQEGMALTRRASDPELTFCEVEDVNAPKSDPTDEGANDADSPVLRHTESTSADAHKHSPRPQTPPQQDSPPPDSSTLVSPPGAFPSP